MENLIVSDHCLKKFAQLTGKKSLITAGEKILELIGLATKVVLKPRFRAWNAMKNLRLCDFYRFNDWVFVVDPTEAPSFSGTRMVVTCYRAEAYRFQDA